MLTLFARASLVRLASPKGAHTLGLATLALAALLTGSPAVEAAPPKASGGISLEPIPASQKPVYRPYLTGTLAPGFALDALAYRRVLETLQACALYPPDARATERAVRLEVRRLLREGGEATSVLDRLPGGPRFAERIVAAYSRDIAPNLLWYAILRGTLQGLDDPNAAFLTAAEQQSRLYSAHNSGGVGLMLQQTLDRRLLINEVLPDSPAARAGVLGGDQLVGVGGAPCWGWSVADVAQRVRGPINTPLTLKVRRQGSTRVVHLVRTPIRTEAVTASMRAGGVEYLRVRSLTPRATALLAEHLRRKAERQARRLILDLRGVQGPDCASALALCSLLATPGQVLGTLEGPRRSPVLLHAEGEGFPAHRLAVLIDRQTGGAAELAAALLRDAAYARLFGTRSQGNGTETLCYTLPDKSVACFSSARYRMPRAGTFDRTGLLPDTLCTLVPEPIGSEADPALTQAMMWINAADNRPRP